MAKKHSTLKSLISALVILALCFTMFVGTTFAWFTDSVTSSNNIIKSGTLDVGMYWLEGDEDPASTTWNDASTGAIFNNDLWEPGYVEAKHVKIANEGTLAFRYALHIVPNGTVDILADVIDVYYIEGATQITRDMLAAATPVGTLRDIINEADGAVHGILLPAGATVTVPDEEVGEVTATIAFKMQESAGNDYQNKSIGTDFSVQLLATQYIFEEDSFDKEYDKEAMLPSVETSTIEGGESIEAGNVTVTLPSDASEAEYTLKVDSQQEEKDADGKTTYSLNIDLLKDGVKAPSGVEYDVDINLGKNVFINTLIHNGDPITDYTYNPTNNVVSFKTTSFSPFEVVYTDPIIKVSNVEELQTTLNEIKTSAKQQIPGELGNKSYREEVIIVLEDDIVIDSTTKFMYTDGNGAPLHFYGVKGILDLNGHNITVSSDALVNGKAYANAVLLIQYSNIDIIGEGSIIAENKSIPVYGWANSTVNIYSGNYITNAYERNESAVYVNNPTVMINVYGGSYNDSEYAFNVHDNCGTTTTIVLHEGITYDTYLKNGTTDVTQSDINKGRIVVAEGCELVTTDGVNLVVKK